MKYIYLIIALLFSLTSYSQEDYRTYLNSGIEKEKSGDWKGALSDYSFALLIQPGVPELLYKSGTLKYFMQDYMNSINDFTLAISTDSLNKDLFFARGNSHVQMSFNSEAISDYSSCLKLDSTDLDCRYNLGVILYKTGMTEKACIELNKVRTSGDTLSITLWKKLCR